MNNMLAIIGTFMFVWWVALTFLLAADFGDGKRGDDIFFGIYPIMPAIGATLIVAHFVY